MKTGLFFRSHQQIVPMPNFFFKENKNASYEIFFLM